MPSERTFQRRIRRIDRYTKDYYRHGASYAEKLHGAYYERKRPKLPLQEVEVDHTTLDVLVIDDRSDLVLGRPDIITFKDRCTGVVLGMSIGWEVPSYASFLEGLRHALYPKDMSRFPAMEKGWPFYGRFKRLYVDNAMHFIGIDIANAASELKFELAEFRPGQPWLKGAQERLFRILNEKVVHKLPGATMSNVAERQSYDDIKGPKLTLDEQEAFLTWYICEDYHYSKRAGLGPLRSLSDIPARLWRAGIQAVKIPPLPDPEIFAALAGNVDTRTIQHTGIRWDHILYNSEALIPIVQHENHRRGRGDHSSTGYKVTRDPQDLGHIWVFDPYRNISVKVPAVRQDYASGTSLHQHKVLVAQHKKEVGDAIEIDHLMRTRGRLAEAVKRIRAERQKRGTARKMARFIGRQKQKRQRSIVETPVTTAQDGAPDGLLLAAAPDSRVRYEPGSHHKEVRHGGAQVISPASHETPGFERDAPSIGAPAPDDLEEELEAWRRKYDDGDDV